MRTSIFLTFILLMNTYCVPESPVNPSNERVLYPVECDYSPILYGSIQIYSEDSNQIESIDINYEYVPFGTYYVKLQALTGLGVIYRTQGRFEKAEEFYLPSLKIDLDFPEAYTSLVLIELNKKISKRLLNMVRKLLS